MSATTRGPGDGPPFDSHETPTDPAGFVEPLTKPRASPVPAPAPGVKRRAFGLSDVGRKRQHNEDAYLVDDEVGLYVVADGMGGHAAGEVASQESVEAVFNMVARGVTGLAPLVGSPTDDEV